MALGIKKAESRAGFQRRFTLLDGMIAIAALAAELGLIRSLEFGFDWEFHSKFWTETRWFFRSWAIDKFVMQIFQLATTAALCSTIAALAYRLRRPRPRWRRLAGQPGTAAIMVAVASSTMTLPLVALRFSESPESSAGTFLGMVAVLAGFGVATRWAMLLLARRWQSEPSWIDRLGRLVGLGWIALSLWAISLRMVC
jgi:hypothetical protein